MNESYIIQFMAYGAAGFTLLISAIVFMLIAQNKRRYLYMAETKDREYQYKNELLNAQLELQEHLLNQVTQEIHDNVGQVLSLVKLHLYSVGNQPANERSKELLNTSSTLLDKAIEDLRKIGHAQSASIVERLGLKDAIMKELDYIKALKNQDCGIEVNGNPYSMLPEQELFIYRIAQEAISNSIKHGHGSMLNVILKYEKRMFTMVINDNGKGFDINSSEAKRGIGMSHMWQRAKLLQAEMEINSILNQGTTLTLKMPVNK